MTSALYGKVQTVLGLIDPDQLGVTFTHEHLLHDIPLELFRHPLPSKLSHFKDAPVIMENLGWIRQYPYCFDDNNVFTEEVVRDPIIEEMLFFKKCGGGTIVDNGSFGVRAKTQHKFLEKVSKTTGVQIIFGTGFYVERSQSSQNLGLSQEAMADKMREEIFSGVNGTNIKCGVIGEIGCSWPLTHFERRSLVASAIVQSETGCPVTIHPGRDRTAPEEILRIYQEAGGKAERFVMGHLDRTLFNEEDLLTFASLGTFCQFDLFGIEVSHYQHAPNVDMPNDARRIALIHSLVKEGYSEKILLSHDIHTKHRIMKYGGHGYSHILVNVIPKMLTRGITQEDVNNFLINNPRKWLTFQ